MKNSGPYKLYLVLFCYAGTTRGLPLDYRLFRQLPYVLLLDV